MKSRAPLPADWSIMLPPPTAPAMTDSLTLEATIERLAAHDVIDAVMLFGSGGTGTLTPASDYDLVLILRALPAPLYAVSTWIDGRMAEVHCLTVAALEQLAAKAPTLRDDGPGGALAGWLVAGRIMYDRAGRLAQAQEAIRKAPPPALPGDHDIYMAWLRTSYTLLHTKRYLASSGPVAPLVLDCRLLFSLDQLLERYFLVRRLPWRGHKEAFRYLTTDDPGWLDGFRQCLAEPDRRRKLEQYEALAKLTLAPVGELWVPGTVAVNPDPSYGVETDEAPGTIENALAFWQELVGEAAR